MKKILFAAYTFFLSVQVYALCPLDSDSNICTVPDLKNQIQPKGVQNENIIPFAQEQLPVKQPETLTPLNTNINNKTRQFQNDSACQFGVCVQDFNNTNNKTQ